MTAPRVAIVHDYLTQRGGAERVVLSMCKAFPGARLLTSTYNADMTYPEFKDLDVETSWLNKVPAFRRDPRLALPFLPQVFRRWKIDADVVLVSSSGWAHGVTTAAPKVVYCYNPPRWLYQREEYVDGLPWFARPALAASARVLIRLDQRCAAEARSYLTLSTVVRDRIRRTYGRDAEILPPPVGLRSSANLDPVPGLKPGFLLIISRARSYKNVDVVCEALAALPHHRLVVVGSLPSKTDGGAWSSNIIELGRVSDARLGWLYQNCTAVIAAAHEDFGLTPLEGNQFGKPAVVLRAGGFLDTLRPGVSGLFIEHLDAAGVVDAVRRLDGSTFDEGRLKEHARSYNEERFISELRRVVLGACPTAA